MVHYHPSLAHEIVRSRPTLTYVTLKSEVLKTLGPHIKPRSIMVSKLNNSCEESQPKKHKCDLDINQELKSMLDENHKLSEKLSSFDPKTIVESVVNTVQSNTGQITWLWFVLWC